jgi:Methyltransferase domain
MSAGIPQDFSVALAQSLGDGTFVRVTLGKYRGTGDATKVVVTPVVIKGAPHLKFVTSHARKDVTANFSQDAALLQISELLARDYLSATLFTTAFDIALQFNKKREPHLVRSKPTFANAAPAAHNRAKSYVVDPAAPWLAGLGVSDAKGVVKPSMYGKFKQICHFVDIIDGLISETPLRDAQAITVTDIGSGKGYLTFALYDHLAGKLGKAARVTGVEVRAELVTLCNDLAARDGMSGLSFEAVAAARSVRKALDILIALHACDTATDDAIFMGLQANAQLIVTAPCCQHEIAPQLGAADDALAGLLKFGLFKQRQADLVTDAARCLLLEAQGYKVKVIEFISTEHTAKNLIIAAVRSALVDREAARKQYDALKTLTGFTRLHLESLVAGSGQ